MFPMCTIYLAAYSGFIEIRGMMGLTGKLTGAAAALTMSRTAR